MLINDRRTNQPSQPGSKSGLCPLMLKAIDVIADTDQDLLPKIRRVGVLQPESFGHSPNDTTINGFEFLPRLAIGMIAQADQDTRSGVGNAQVKIRIAGGVSTKLHATRLTDLSEKFQDQSP